MKIIRQAEQYNLPAAGKSASSEVHDELIADLLKGPRITAGTMKWDGEDE